MTKRTTATVLAFLLAFTVCNVNSFASSSAEREARLTEKIKMGIAKLGIGQSTRVTIKLKDKTEMTGYIREISDTGFVIGSLNESYPVAVEYSNVAQVKGNNLSTGAKVAIGVGIVVGVIIVLYLVRGAFCDGC